MRCPIPTRPARCRLIDKGVIEPVGHGLVRFTMPGFAPWVLTRDEG